MKENNKLMNTIQKNITEITEDLIPVSSIKKSLSASDSDSIYMITKHDKHIPEFVMITKDKTLLGNMNYLLEDTVFNDKLIIKKPNVCYKNKTKYGIKVFLNNITRHTYNLKKYSYYVHTKLVYTNTNGIYFIPVFKCMSVGRLICVGKFIAKSMTDSKNLTELDIIGFSLDGFCETFNAYKKLFEESYDVKLDLTQYSEISFDSVDIEDFVEDYAPLWSISELDDVLSRIIFVINSRKYLFHKIFTEDKLK